MSLNLIGMLKWFLKDPEDWSNDAENSGIYYILE